MASKRQKVHAIIHAASATAAGIGAGLAQLPGSDSVPLIALQEGMIISIALVHGRKISEGAATGVVGTMPAAMGGRFLSQWLIGWWPGVGNAINASTAAAITEAVGWAAHAFFEKLGDEPSPGGK